MLITEIKKNRIMTFFVIACIIAIFSEIITIEDVYADNKKAEKETEARQKAWSNMAGEVITDANDTCVAARKARAKKIAAEKRAKAQKIAAAKVQSTQSSGSYTSSYSGNRLTPSAGTINGPSGKETYYNLNMSGVVSIMRRAGFSEAQYPYHVRTDGVKMLGNYVMVAANLNLRPRGSTVQTSLGIGLVCDTGGFATSNPRQLDIATAW